MQSTGHGHQTLAWLVFLGSGELVGIYFLNRMMKFIVWHKILTMDFAFGIEMGKQWLFPSHYLKAVQGFWLKLSQPEIIGKPLH